MERLRAAIEQARKTRAANEAAGEAASDAVIDPADLSAPPKAAWPARKVNGIHKAEDAVLNGDAGIGMGLRQNPEVEARWNALKLSVPRPRRLRFSRLIGTDAKGPERSAIDMLRTRLLTQMHKAGWKRVAVTSPTMACGKSTTTLNLALSLSRLPDVKTIVFETDMRRPSMAKMLGIRGKQSVFDLLGGKAEFAEQAVRIADNVAVSLNHGIVKNTAEILYRPRTGAVLDMVIEAYQPDVVLFDMPPMMQSDDTLGFIRNVDCAVLIALAETTTLPQVDFCEKELAAHTNVAGIVLNRCRFTGGGYGYGSDY